MHVTKMQGLGNDYLYLNCLESVPEDLPGLAVRLSDRHFGVGADGLIAIRPGVSGDFSMDMYNADGSQGTMCGNGIRCVGKYVYDKGLTRKTCLTIDTGAGPRALELQLRRGQVVGATVDMGEPVVLPSLEIEVEGTSRIAWPVEIGNRHLVLFCPEPENVPLERVGPVLERLPQFPERVNVEFAAPRSWDRLDVRVWERGSGMTLACGTGACAVLAAAVKSGQCGRTASVRLPGGVLDLDWRRAGNHIFLTGPAVTVFECEVEDIPSAR